MWNLLACSFLFYSFTCLVSFFLTIQSFLFYLISVDDFSKRAWLVCVYCCNRLLHPSLSILGIGCNTLSDSFTHSLSLSLPYFTMFPLFHSYASLSLSLTHTVSLSHTLSHTQSLSLSLVYSYKHSLTLSRILSHTVSLSLIYSYKHSLPLSRILSHAHPIYDSLSHTHTPPPLALTPFYAQICVCRSLSIRRAHTSLEVFLEEK
jgi:hypothetical protein